MKGQGLTAVRRNRTTAAWVGTRITREGKRLGLLFALGVLSAAALEPATVAAQVVYHWVDEQGVEHFSELPPANVKADVYMIQAGTTVQSGIDPRAGERDAGAPENSYRAFEEQARQAREQRQELAAAAQREAEERERMAAICESQRAQLARLVPRVRVLVRDDDGSVRQLDSDERLAMIDEIEQFLEENCD